MPGDNPSTPPSVLKQAINAVPAVKYALGVGGIISVIAIVRGFGIDFRVALWGTVVMLVLMTVLLVFAKASSRPQSAFKGPAFILTWFSLLLFMATATALFLSVFFGKPLDLRTLLAPVHAGQTPVEKHGTAEVLPPTTDRVDVTVKQAPSQAVTATVGHGKNKLRAKIGDLITEGTKIRDRAPIYVGTPIRVNGEPDVMAEWTIWTAKVEQFLNTNFDAAEVAKFRALDDPNTSLNSKIHGEITYLEQLLDKVAQESHTSTTTNTSGSIVNNGGVINNPTINNASTTPKADLQFSFSTLSPNEFPILETSAPLVDGAVTIEITALNRGTAPAKNGWLILTICNQCRYAEEPLNMVPAPTPQVANIVRERPFEEIYAGTIAVGMKLKIIPPAPPYDTPFLIGASYACEGCPPTDPKKQQLLKVNVFK